VPFGGKHENGGKNDVVRKRKEAGGKTPMREGVYFFGKYPLSEGRLESPNAIWVKKY
jgi:hypothetical protein